MKNRAQRAQEQNRARASPSGTACLIGKKLISLAPWRCSPASFRSPWSAKTSQMGVLYPATPKIYNFPPEIPPNEPNSERTTWPLLLAMFTCIYWSLPSLLNSPTLLYTPALSSGTPGISTILPAQSNNPITNPNQTQHYSRTFKF